MTTARRELALADGVLAFPLTPFHADGTLDLARFSSYLEEQLAFGPGALFVACGTGEYASLSCEEHALVVATAVEVAAGRVSVIAGAGVNGRVAADQARAAADAGADGLLLLPPYLTVGPQAGLEGYVRTVAAASDLPIVLYQRGTASYAAETVARLRDLPQLVGFKDGLGNLEQMNRILLAAGDDLLYFNGLPTAELQAEAYRAIGTPHYSSAVFAMAPEIATTFYRAYRAMDTSVTVKLLSEFYAPLAALRDTVPGYAVSLIKAGAALRGAGVGPVRAPLVDPTPDHLETLRGLLERGLALADAS